MLFLSHLFFSEEKKQNSSSQVTASNSLGGLCQLKIRWLASFAFLFSTAGRAPSLGLVQKEA